MSNPITFAVIIPAAGISRRFGQLNKIEQDIAGRAVLVRAVELFAKRPHVEQIIVAVNPDAVDQFKFKWGDKLGFHGAVVVAGGKTERWETVQNALRAVKPTVTHVAVHDAARPLTSGRLIDRVFEAAQTYDAVAPAAPIVGTLKRVADLSDDEAPPADPMDAILGDAGSQTPYLKRVVETVNRTGLVEVQTPQVFKRDLLMRAYEQINAGAIDPVGLTDDTGLIEAMGRPVYLVEGESTNLKITHPDDLQLARAIHQTMSKQESVELAKNRFQELEFEDD